MDIWDYFRHREREAESASASADELQFSAAPDGRAGHVSGRLTLRADAGLDAYLKVSEWVVLGTDGFTVEKYAYYLIINGVEAKAWDKDPSHTSQPVHGHIGADHARVEAEEMTLEQALDESWHEVADVSADDYAG